MAVLREAEALSTIRLCILPFEKKQVMTKTGINALLGKWKWKTQCACNFRQCNILLIPACGQKG